MEQFKIRLDIITEYSKEMEKVCNWILNAKVEKKPFYEYLDMERHTFLRKLKLRSFSAAELMKLSQEINDYHEKIYGSNF